MTASSKIWNHIQMHTPRDFLKFIFSYEIGNNQSKSHQDTKEYYFIFLKTPRMKLEHITNQLVKPLSP